MRPGRSWPSGSHANSHKGGSRRGKSGDGREVAAAGLVAVSRSPLALARFVHAQRSAAEIFSVCFSDGFVRRRVVKLDKAKAARAARFAVGNDRHGLNFAEGGKKVLELGFRRAPGKVAYIDLLQTKNPAPKAHQKVIRGNGRFCIGPERHRLVLRGLIC